MHVNYKYKKSKLKVQKRYILKILNIRSKILRLVQLLNFLRKKLELYTAVRSPIFRDFRIKKIFFNFFNNVY